LFLESCKSVDAQIEPARENFFADPIHSGIIRLLYHSVKILQNFSPPGSDEICVVVLQRRKIFTPTQDCCENSLVDGERNQESRLCELANDNVAHRCGWESGTHVTASIYLGWPTRTLPFRERPAPAITHFS
jgi:hypothetical protein